jgi:hypothetical protein
MSLPGLAIASSTAQQKDISPDSGHKALRGASSLKPSGWDCFGRLIAPVASSLRKNEIPCATLGLPTKVIHPTFSHTVHASSVNARR